MIKAIVVQKTTYICDKCKKEHTVETELEECYRKYEEISEFTPDGFNEIEELKLVLCDDCLKELKSWAKS